MNPCTQQQRPCLLDDDSFDQLVDEVLGSQIDCSLAHLSTKVFMSEPLLKETTHTAQPTSLSPITPSTIKLHGDALLENRTNQAPGNGEQNANSTNHYNFNMMPAIIEKPKRSLSAYNLFFQSERKKLLKALPKRESRGGKTPRNSHGKMGFAEMARIISSRWKKISEEEKAPFDAMAKQDRLRYQREMLCWKRQQEMRQQIAQRKDQQQQQQQQPNTAFAPSPAVMTPTAAHQQRILQSQGIQVINWSSLSMDENVSF